MVAVLGWPAGVSIGRDCRRRGLVAGAGSTVVLLVLARGMWRRYPWSRCSAVHEMSAMEANRDRERVWGYAIG